MSSEESDSRLSGEEVEVALHHVSGADWARVLSMARMCVAGLNGWAAVDLRAEAVVKLLSGERTWRRGVPPLVALTNVMRSIASNGRKRDKNGPIDLYEGVDAGGGTADEDVHLDVQPKDAGDPADIVDGRSQLKYIEGLVIGDEDAEELVAAWSMGLRGKEAAQELNFDEKRYDAARKRLERKLAPAAALRKPA